MRTYRALLRGDHLEWLGEAPQLQTDAPLSVHVTIVEPEPGAEVHTRGPAMAALLVLQRGFEMWCNATPAP
jgi:hypothetical protein